MRTLVESQLQNWINGRNKKEKRNIAINILLEIQNQQPPGRFLVEEDSCITATSTRAQDNNGVSKSIIDPSLERKAWTIVEREKAVEKILKQFRHRSNQHQRDEDDKTCVGEENAVKSPTYPMAKSIDLNDWITSHRRGKLLDSSVSQKRYLEQVVQILNSLVYEILHGHNHVDENHHERGGDLEAGGSVVEEKIYVHPNFINVDNVIVYEETKTSATHDGISGRQTISASFVETGGGSFVFTKGGDDDETVNKHSALYAFGSMAYTMCMMMGEEDGPSTHQMRFPTDNGISETIVSAALNISDARNLPDGEDDISDNLRKNFRTTISEAKDCGTVTTTMFGAGVPFPFCRFVSDLLDNEYGQLFHSEYAFLSFKDVQSDLKQMLGNPNDFLHGSNPDRWTLTFGNELYGRSADLKALLDAADRVAARRDDNRLRRKTEFAMVSGSPGAGKSQLVRVVGTALEKNGWRMLQCKFDRVAHSEPLSIISHMFDEYFQRCGFQQFHTRLRRFIHSEGLEILAMYIPSLHHIMGVALPSIIPDVNTAIMAGLFSALLKSISSEESPLFCFIDDWQWADPLSLDLLTALIREDHTVTLNLSSDDVSHNIEYIMFIGSHRENSVNDNPLLAKALNKLQNDDSINMTHILLTGVSIDTLNEMLSDCLSMPQRRVKSLSELVIQKTDGLPLYVIEFLHALKADKLLTHSLTRGWEWDEISIDIFPITENVAELLAFKLRRLPKETLLGIQIVSIFGTQVDEHIIDLVKNYDGEESVDISTALKVAQSEGLIERAANLINFSHDLIQKATFDSIHDDDRVPLLRKLISVLIEEATITHSLNSVLFVTVDLINRIGCNSISCQRERTLFAELNCRAGSKALAVPDFAGAATYAESGISLLSETCWETQYDLSLRLYDIAVLSHFSINTDDHSQLMTWINTIFERAYDFSDKFNAHRVWIQLLATTDLPLAIEECLVALEHLGEPLDTSNIDYIKACEELLNIESRFSGVSESLVSKPLSDSNKEKAMMIMTSLILYYNQRRSFLSAIVSCRMIEITMNFGYCADSVFGAAAFALSLVTCLRDIDSGNAWGRKAMALMKVCGKQSLVPTISASLFGFVFVWTEPIQSSVDFVAEGIRCSFLYGNIEFARANIQMYLFRSYASGKNIKILAEEVDALTRQHRVHFGSNASSDTFHRFILSPFFNVIRELGVPLEMEVPAADNYDLLKVAIEHDNLFLLHSVNLLQTIKEFVLRDMGKALECTDMYFDHFGVDGMQMRYIYIYNVFYDGLINFHFAGTTGDARYRNRGEHALSTMKEWTRHSYWNFQNKYLLMSAEYHKISNDFAKAATCYDASILAAKEHKFIHEEAIANELAGIFFLEQGNYQRSLTCLKQAIACYKKWGAPAVTRRIESMVEEEFGNDSLKSIDAEIVSYAAPVLNGGLSSTKRPYSH